MSFTIKMSDSRGVKMQTRIEDLERALLRIGTAKKQLGRNTAEAKSRIQCNISRQLEALRNREVWLLNQLDTISGVKEEVLQQQSVRLNKTLGVLQSSIKYPDGNEDAAGNFDRMDLGDLQPEETPHVSFKSDPNGLRDAIMNYGRIDANSVNGLQSPFMDPDHQAPSLPRHFEDYNDAEHHILYKTVEELSRNKGSQSTVNNKIMVPKLSPRLEDWLMPVTKSTPTDPPSQCHISLPKLSNNLSDWLRSPVGLKKDPSPPINDMSKDASIQTWLHKIKQCPMEEEDDYEFIEESETQTQSSGLEQFPDPDEEDTEIWLYRKDLQGTNPQRQTTQKSNIPIDGWLLKTKSTYVQEGDAVDMSRYFAKITDELDKWLIQGVGGKESKDSHTESICLQKPVVPSTLDLSKTFRCHMSRADNPWLLRSSIRSNSFSPVSSRSSISTISSQQKTHCKWLLNGGLDDLPATTQVSCPIMDRYKKNVESFQWIKTGQQSSIEKSDNPMSTFLKMASDQSLWLKAPSTDKPKLEDNVEFPVKKMKCDNIESWLQKSGKIPDINTASPSLSANLLSKGDNKCMWLFSSQLSVPKHDDDVEEIDL